MNEHNTATMSHDDCEHLLRLIAEEGRVTFQTFDESDKKRPALTKILHGSLDQHLQTLLALNKDGAGVFFMVNGGDGKGRRSANVTEVRALFVDLDGAPIEPVLEFPLRPHVTVETSPGHFHCYWNVEGIALKDFSGLQANIARIFGGDPKVKDLPRVMRVPGFLHQKGAPFRTRLLRLEQRPRYTRSEIATAFGLELAGPAPRAPRSLELPDCIPEGERNSTLFNLARGLVNKGHDHEQVLSRIQRVNAERCRPPLCATEVDALVNSAWSHGPRGTLNLPLAVFDSTAYRRLSHAARTVTAVAYRRFNGENNGNIALPFSEFQMEFTRPQTFYRARAEAVRSGLLRRVRKRRYSERGGREPDLYEVLITPPAAPNQKRSAFN